MSEMRYGRRSFLLKASTAIAVALAGSAVGAAVVEAASHMGHEMASGHGGSTGYILEAAVKQHCGTCEFWGGPRLVSQDRKELTITGFGWCNNPVSPNYQKLTDPEHGPMDTWRKWAVLD
jgi:hypothetical protein